MIDAIDYLSRFFKVKIIFVPITVMRIGDQPYNNYVEDALNSVHVNEQVHPET